MFLSIHMHAYSCCVSVILSTGGMLRIIDAVTGTDEGSVPSNTKLEGKTMISSGPNKQQIRYYNSL